MKGDGDLHEGETGDVKEEGTGGLHG